MIGNSAGEHHGITTNSSSLRDEKGLTITIISLGATPVYHGESQLVSILVLVCVFKSF